MKIELNEKPNRTPVSVLRQGDLFTAYGTTYLVTSHRFDVTKTDTCAVDLEDGRLCHFTPGDSVLMVSNGKFTGEI